MSETFTKIGGYIASGDAMVYADSATMTGDGTVQNPFGVKASQLYVQEPLYYGQSGTSGYIGWRPDETVIYSGNYDLSTTGQINFTDNPYNYSQLEFWAVSYPTYKATLAAVCDVKDDPGQSVTNIPMCSIGANDMMGAIRFNLARLDLNTSGVNVLTSCQFSINAAGTVSTGTTPTKLYKVVGKGKRV